MNVAKLKKVKKGRKLWKGTIYTLKHKNGVFDSAAFSMLLHSIYLCQG